MVVPPLALVIYHELDCKSGRGACLSANGLLCQCHCVFLPSTTGHLKSKEE
jgi:hypothetical protein